MIDDMYVHNKYLSKSFDEKIRDIDGLKWLPWVGQSYFKKSQKILILGESHYNWGENNATQKLNNETFTRYVVSDQGLSHINKTENNRRIFRNIERTIFGEGHVGTNKRELLWSNVVFMNLVQVAMNTLEVRPSAFDYSSGWSSCLELVRLIKPTVILVLGTENPKIKEFQNICKEEVKWECKVGRFWKKSSYLSKFNCDVVFIRHPSSFYSWSKWHSEINKYVPKEWSL